MRAARSNDTRAQFNLGVCYQEGLGVEKDLHKAAKWYCRAVIAPQEHLNSALIAPF